MAPTTPSKFGYIWNQFIVVVSGWTFLLFLWTGVTIQFFMVWCPNKQQKLVLGRKKKETTIFINNKNCYFFLGLLDKIHRNENKTVMVIRVSSYIYIYFNVCSSPNLDLVMQLGGTFMGHPSSALCRSQHTTQLGRTHSTWILFLVCPHILALLYKLAINGKELILLPDYYNHFRYDILYHHQFTTTNHHKLSSV